MVKVTNRYTDPGTARVDSRDLKTYKRSRIGRISKGKVPSTKMRKYQMQKAKPYSAKLNQMSTPMYQSISTNSYLKQAIKNTMMQMKTTKYIDFESNIVWTFDNVSLGTRAVRQIYGITPGPPGSNNYSITQGDGHQNRTGDSVDFRGFRLQGTFECNYSESYIPSGPSHGQWVQQRIRRMIVAVKIVDGRETQPNLEDFQALPRNYQDRYGSLQEVGALQNRFQENVKVLEDKYIQFRPLKPFARQVYKYLNQQQDSWELVEQPARYQRGIDTAANDLQWTQENKYHTDTYIRFPCQFQYYPNQTGLMEGWAFYEVVYFDENLTDFLPDNANNRYAQFFGNEIKRHYWKDDD